VLQEISLQHLPTAKRVAEDGGFRPGIATAGTGDVIPTLKQKPRRIHRRSGWLRDSRLGTMDSEWLV
jgi:hypothetical protein